MFTAIVGLYYPTRLDPTPCGSGRSGSKIQKYFYHTRAALVSILLAGIRPKEIFKKNFFIRIERQCLM